MGRFIFSQSKTNLEEEVNQLKVKIDKDKDNLVTKDELLSYFHQLTNKIDHNNDGVITQDELESYVKTQMDDKNEEIEKWKNLYQDIKMKNLKLVEEVERLRAYLDFATGEDKIERRSYISSEHITNYIENNLLNTDSNLKYIPDALERKAYFNIYKTSLESLKQLCNTSCLNTINHKITLSLTPINN